MEYEIEERPLQMGEDWEQQGSFDHDAPSPGPMTLARRLAGLRDRAVLIPEQEPLS